MERSFRFRAPEADKLTVGQEDTAYASLTKRCT